MRDLALRMAELFLFQTYGLDKNHKKINKTWGFGPT